MYNFQLKLSTCDPITWHDSVKVSNSRLDLLQNCVIFILLFPLRSDSEYFFCLDQPNTNTWCQISAISNYCDCFSLNQLMEYGLECTLCSWEGPCSSLLLDMHKATASSCLCLLILLSFTVVKVAPLTYIFFSVCICVQREKGAL